MSRCSMLHSTREESGWAAPACIPQNSLINYILSLATLAPADTFTLLIHGLTPTPETGGTGVKEPPAATAVAAPKRCTDKAHVN